MAEEGEATEGGGKKKLIILIVVALLLIGLSIGGTMMALKILSPPPVVENTEAGSEAMSAVKKSAIYYPIKPEIVVNYGDKGRQRYAQIEVTLLIREEDVIPAVELHAPMITNALIMVIGGQTYEEVQTAEGKELLRQQCLQAIQKILEKEIGKPGIEQVLFTNFVMQ
jgi:flagellar FliL protein